MAIFFFEKIRWNGNGLVRGKSTGAASDELKRSVVRHDLDTMTKTLVQVHVDEILTLGFDRNATLASRMILFARGGDANRPN